jgi:hypothetical protein
MTPISQQGGALPEQRVRYSTAALLRLEHAGGHVLFRSKRSGLFGPPGGVYRAHMTAQPALDALGWVPERAGDERLDLRGQVPESRLGDLLTWLHSGADRETPQECLRRELAEELAEVGFPELAGLAAGIEVTTFGWASEAAQPVEGKPYLQGRHHDVLELLLDQPATVELHDALVELGRDPHVDTVLLATTEQIVDLRAGDLVIQRHADYVIDETVMSTDEAGRAGCYPARPCIQATDQGRG